MRSSKYKPLFHWCPGQLPWAITEPWVHLSSSDRKCAVSVASSLHPFFRPLSCYCWVASCSCIQSLWAERLDTSECCLWRTSVLCVPNSQRKTFKTFEIQVYGNLSWRCALVCFCWGMDLWTSAFLEEERVFTDENWDGGPGWQIDWMCSSATK